MSNKKRSRRTARQGRRWQPLAVLFGLAVALMAIILVAQAMGSSGPSPVQPQPTKADVVPPAPSPSPSPTPSPSPSPATPNVPQIISSVPQVLSWPLQVTSVTTTATSTTTQLQCLPLEFQSYVIQATITVADPSGGTVTYHWQSSDGFVSPDKTVSFAPGQKSAVVTDTWTLGAGNANGLTRWEEAVVTSPETMVRTGRRSSTSAPR